MRITPEMFRAHAAAKEAEKSFSREVWRAKALETIGRPPSENYLHVAAREVWEGGGYSEREHLVQLLYQDPTVDRVLNMDERLRITFDPQGNNTRKWGPETAHGVWDWLVERISEPPEDKSVICVQVDPESVEARVRGDLSKYMDPELRDFIRGDSYGSILPKRQAQAVYLYGQLHDPSRPRETVAAVAEEMGITPATVRGYLAAARRDPELRDELRRLGYEFYKSFQTTKRLGRISNTE